MIKNIIAILIISISWTIGNGCRNKTKQIIEPGIITVEEVREKITKGTPVMIDVRTEGEYYGSMGHVDGSILIPLHELDRRLKELEPYKNQNMIIICRSGNRSGKATAYLRNHGYKAMSMDGGMLKWNSTK